MKEGEDGAYELLKGFVNPYVIRYILHDCYWLRDVLPCE